MSSSQLFLLVNILGGISVLGSYCVGLIASPNHRQDLWGGITIGLRKTFIGSMVLATVGYLLFLHYMLFHSGLHAPADDFLISGYLPSILCATFLVSSSVWMPSTLAHISCRRPFWWGLSLTSLWITSISLLVLTVLVMVQYNEGQWLSKTIGTIGILYITAHCILLDSVVWVRKFPKQ